MHHTVNSLAKLLQVSDEQILAHIRGGRLKAVNVGGGNVRPRWRISEAQLYAFLESRTVSATPAKRRKRRAITAATEFF
jgi:excisionase family DNA binding protein